MKTLSPIEALVCRKVIECFQQTGELQTRRQILEWMTPAPQPGKIPVFQTTDQADSWIEFLIACKFLLPVQGDEPLLRLNPEFL